jgi:hypothetical protein
MSDVPQYYQRISRQNPGCMVILVDQSFSMSKKFGSAKDAQPKKDACADAANEILSACVIACRHGRDIVHRLDIGVIGYGGKNAASAFGGSLRSRGIVPIDEVAKSPPRMKAKKLVEKDTDGNPLKDADGNLVGRDVSIPVWIEAVADGGTPMDAAFEVAKTWLSEWVDQHRDSFPPIVLNITDGEPTEGPPFRQTKQVARELMDLQTTNGNVLLFNCHISDADEEAVLFPRDDSALTMISAKFLFDITSPVPESMLRMAEEYNLELPAGARGFMYKANAEQMVLLLRFGSSFVIKPR